jgi:transposase-like protein
VVSSQTHLGHVCPGSYRCNACRETLYERSHISPYGRIAAAQLLMVSKKGVSAMQIYRMLGVSYKTAWSMGSCS